MKCLLDTPYADCKVGDRNSKARQNVPVRVGHLIQRRRFCPQLVVGGSMATGVTLCGKRRQQACRHALQENSSGRGWG